jgi:hypothetical protein
MAVMLVAQSLNPLSTQLRSCSVFTCLVVLQESELTAAAEEAEAQQSALKVLVHEYREKLDAAKRKCDTPLDAVMKEVGAGVRLSC